MTTVPDETFVSAKVNGELNSPGLAWYSSASVFQARMFGAMLSPESGGSFTAGCIGRAGGLVWLTGGTGIGAGSGFASEVLQPANSANDNPVVAAAKIMRLSENIPAFVRHRVSTDKFLYISIKFLVCDLRFSFYDSRKPCWKNPNCATQPRRTSPGQP